MAHQDSEDFKEGTFAPPWKQEGDSAALRLHLALPPVGGKGRCSTTATVLLTVVANDAEQAEADAAVRSLLAQWVRSTAPNGGHENV